MFLHVLLALLFGTLCADQAKKRGRHPVIWFFLGASFNLLALLTLFILPSLSGEERGAKEKEEDQKLQLLPADQPASTQIPYLGDPRCRQWFFLDSTKVPQGPVAFRNLHNAWDQKQLSAESFVWTEGMLEWKPIRAIPALFERLTLFS